MEKNSGMSMREKIGKVTLDYSLYPGVDYYSEGGSEDTLLSLVKLHDESKFNQVIMEFWSWPVLYHLSHIRGNIAQWLPIGQGDSVLEIGSGCGAVTGTLADKAKKVTCIELSRKRSLINAHRNKNRDNIEILVGNFQDIEGKLEEKYDYITLIGVLEYASSYIRGESPYEEFLKTVARRLAPGGRIVVAIENKYGLKYWAGCREDHTGRYYEGIEGYPSTEGVRTFSRKEFEKLAGRCELKSEFYYPYPDYKFPMAIYSDGYLPKLGELNNNIRNFDGDRVVAFNETMVFDGLIREGMFPFFSNSFLVLLEREDSSCNNREQDRTLFVKFSNERAKELMVRTDILETEDGKRRVRKTAMGAAAFSHVDGMKESARALMLACEGTRLEPNRITDGRASGTACFEYLTGRTLEERLDELLAEEEFEGMLGLIREFIGLAERTAGTEPFRATDEFKRIFGEDQPEGELKGNKISNLDLIFSNILEDESGKWNVIDYEWTFRFSIPVKFILYRALYYYLLSGKRKALTEYLDAKRGEERLYEMAGITPGQRRVFEAWEGHFQRYIVGDTVSLYVAHALVAGLTLPLDKLVAEGSRMAGLHAVKVYYDFGGGFSEENAHFVRGILKDSHQVSVDVPVEPGAVRLRIDPTEFPCVIRILRFSSKREGEFTYQVNGVVCLDQTVFFETSDTQILLDHLTGEDREFHLEYQVDVLEEAVFQNIVEAVSEMQYREVCGRPSLEERMRYRLGLSVRPEDPRTLPFRTMVGNKK